MIDAHCLKKKKKKANSSKNGKEKVSVMEIPLPRGSLYAHTVEKSFCIYVNTKIGM